MPSISQFTEASTSELTEDGYLVFQTSEGKTRRVSVSAFKQHLLCESFCATVDVPAADVLTINSSPVELLPAPEAGTAYQFISVFMRATFNTAAYATYTQMDIVGASGGGDVTMSGTYLNFVADIYGQRIELADHTVSDSLIQTAVQLTNSTGDPTAGDSDLKFFLHYRIVTL